MSARMAFNAIAMVAIGWISCEAYAHVYGKAYTAHEARFIAGFAGKKTSAKLTYLASLVPFLGGQWLTVGMQYHSVGANMLLGGGAQRRHDSLHFVKLDDKHGDDCEKPPHGHASKLSSRKFPAQLAAFVSSMRAAGIDPPGHHSVALCLGQGLGAFHRGKERQRLNEALEASGIVDEMNVYPSAVTHASKVQDLGLEAALGL
jgi:hypothetical protein